MAAPFPSLSAGLSTKFFTYYSSGFLSLQAALNAHIYTLQPGYDTLNQPPFAYGVPFPIKAYTHNQFFDFAGNLIGLVVVVSLLIPLSTMLR